VIFKFLIKKYVKKIKHTRTISELGVVKGAAECVQLANSLNRLDERDEFLVQFINPFMESVELPTKSL